MSSKLSRRWPTLPPINRSRGSSHCEACRKAAVRFVTVDNIRVWLCVGHYAAFQRMQLEVIVSQGSIRLHDIAESRLC